ncbi:ATPase [Trypanosoma melophagium]|uniref:ATPase n=1 Tax=Trypanosoma melophagium TaxID=715481 RepID=UPI00351A8128|nr:ATPase [Trypanosoma melophagium]
MLYRFTQRSACQPCIHTLLVLFLFLLHFSESTAEEVVKTFYFQQEQQQDKKHKNNNHSDNDNDVLPTGGVELLAISGCKRPSRPGRSRETYHCFAGSRKKEPVQIFIRGRGFPTDTPLRIQLQEHTPLPLGVDAKMNTDLITMECLNVKASDVFPHQILSCTLPHPGVSLQKKSQWLKRLSHHLIWMDLELAVDKRLSSSRGSNSVTLGVLHHSVQLDLTLERENSIEGNLNNADPLDEKGEISNDGVISDDPLELFLEKGHRKSSNGEEWLSLGIGGLKNQLELLYRRVFLGRTSSLRDVVGSVELPHVRGVMLHGPPGNGKTLIARAIAKLLGKNTKVTIVNAADILSKYVGDSEKNLRDLILGDDDDNDDDYYYYYDNNGGYGGDADINSNGINDNDVDENRNDFNTEFQEGNNVRSEEKEGRLHTIIIDEIESLFRRRGDSSDGSSAKAVYDGLTNQLLTLMDGVDRPRNILIIGLTNQLHSIDRALLRPGRFEVVIEIPLPDFEGRTEMLFIHTQKLREKHHLAQDVNLDLLAARTGGFSGADIAGTVRAAVSYALMRYRDYLEDTSVKENYLNEESDLHTEVLPKQFQVTNDDFNLAIQDMLDSMQQILPGKQYSGIARDDSTTPLIDFDGSITKSINATRRVLESIQHSQAEHAVIVIIYGPPGTGKTFLSHQLVKLLPFDIVRFIMSSKLNGNTRGDNMMDEIVVGLREAVNSRGNYSLVIENVERILSEGGSTTWDILKSTIQDFKESTSIPSLLQEETKKKPHGKRILILTTSEKETLHNLMHSIEYDVQLTLNLIQRKNLQELLQDYGILPSNAEMANEVVHSYPPKLSYRQFLRITDLALWRAHDAELKVNTNVVNNHQTTSLYSSLNALFLKGGKFQKGAGVSGMPSLDTKESQRVFCNAVQEVVSLMGLSDVFDDFPTMTDALEGDEVYW